MRKGASNGNIPVGDEGDAPRSRAPTKRAQRDLNRAPSRGAGVVMGRGREVTWMGRVLRASMSITAAGANRGQVHPLGNTSPGGDGEGGEEGGGGGGGGAGLELTSANLAALQSLHSSRPTPGGAAAAAAEDPPGFPGDLSRKLSAISTGSHDSSEERLPNMTATPSSGFGSLPSGGARYVSLGASSKFCHRLLHPHPTPPHQPTSDPRRQLRAWRGKGAICSNDDARRPLLAAVARAARTWARCVRRCAALTGVGSTLTQGRRLEQ